MSSATRQNSYPLSPRTVLITSLAAWATMLAYQLVVPKLLGVDAHARYPAVFRSPEEFQARALIALVGTFLSTVATVLLYGHGVKTGGVAEGLRFGGLVCAFYFFGVTLTLFAQMNVGADMIVMGGGRWVVGMLLASMVIGALAKPRSAD